LTLSENYQVLARVALFVGLAICKTLPCWLVLLISESLLRYSLYQIKWQTLLQIISRNCKILFQPAACSIPKESRNNRFICAPQNAKYIHEITEEIKMCFIWRMNFHFHSKFSFSCVLFMSCTAKIFEEKCSCLSSAFIMCFWFYTIGWFLSFIYSWKNIKQQIFSFPISWTFQYYIQKTELGCLKWVRENSYTASQFFF
jgi:hypothetical protein